MVLPQNTAEHIAVNIAEHIANTVNISVNVYRNSTGFYILTTDIDPAPYKSWVLVRRITRGY